LAVPRTVEQRIDTSLDRGGYPLGDDLAVLCRYRANPPGPTAVVLSEQSLRRFNRGDPLGGECGRRTDQRTGDDVLLGFYPIGTRSVEHRLVRFDRGGPAQRHAQAFGAWLSTAPGRQALRDAGLRPQPGPHDEAPSQQGQEHGVLPQARVDQAPVPPEMLAAALLRHTLAHRYGRVLLALDGSGSMAESAGYGQGTLFDVATLGVRQALDLMGERDEFGLWVFPDGRDGQGAGDLVPIGRRDDTVGAQPRHAATAAALTQARPVGHGDPNRISALVVLTDGRNTSPNLTPAQVREAVQGRGVRLFVLAVGKETCASIGLREVASTTGGWCADVNLGSIGPELAELFRILWSGGLDVAWIAEFAHADYIRSLDEERLVAALAAGGRIVDDPMLLRIGRSPTAPATACAGTSPHP